MIFSNAGKNDLFPIIHEYFFFFSREKYNNRNEISTLHALKTQKKRYLDNQNRKRTNPVRLCSKEIVSH